MCAFDFDNMTCFWPPWGLGSRSEIGVQPRLRGDGRSEIVLIHNPD
jgi:hypothetical protein